MERDVVKFPPQELSKIALKRLEKQEKEKTTQWTISRIREAVNPKYLQNKIANNLNNDFDKVDSKLEQFIVKPDCASLSKDLVNQEFNGLGYKRIRKEEDIKNLANKYTISEKDLEDKAKMFFVPVFPEPKADQLVVIKNEKIISMTTYSSEGDLRQAKVKFLANKEIDRVLVSASRLNGEKMQVDFDKICFNIAARIDPNCKGLTVENIKKNIEPKDYFQKEKNYMFVKVCEEFSRRFPAFDRSSLESGVISFLNGKFICSLNRSVQAEVRFIAKYNVG